MSQTRTFTKLTCAIAFHFFFSPMAEPAEPLLSTELEFSNDEIAKQKSSYVNHPMTVKYKNKFKQAVMDKCGDCRAEKKKDAYGANIWRIHFRDGWWFEITTDPGALEIKTKPSTAKRLKQLKYRMQKYIFDTAHSLGTIGRQLPDSAAHLHIGIQAAFGTNTMQFRNFLVDYSNFHALASDILHSDHANAPALMGLGNHLINEFKKITNPRALEGLTITELAAQLREKVFIHSLPGFDPPAKYQSASLNRINPELFSADKQTLEIRALPAHESAESFIHIANLFTARIAYIKKHGNKPIPFVKKDMYMKPQEAVDQFFTYVVQSGLHWRDYLHLVDTSYRAIPPSMKAMIKVFGNTTDPSFVQHMFDMIHIGIYNKKTIAAWLHQAKAKNRRLSKKIETQIKKAPKPITSFEDVTNQPVKGHVKAFLEARKRARVSEEEVKQNTRLQPTYGELHPRLKPVDHKIIESVYKKGRKMKKSSAKGRRLKHN